MQQGKVVALNTSIAMNASEISLQCDLKSKDASCMKKGRVKEKFKFFSA